MPQFLRQVRPLFEIRLLLRIIGRREVARIYCAVRFPSLLIASGVILMTVCADMGQTPTGEESGIEGTITVSPARPGPTRVDAPNSAPLANAAFSVESNNAEVASFTTDNKGHFRTALTPGHYKVSLKGRKTSIGHFGPFEVDVVAGKITIVQWECDSGMR